MNWNEAKKIGNIYVLFSNIYFKDLCDLYKKTSFRNNSIWFLPPICSGNVCPRDVQFQSLILCMTSWLFQPFFQNMLVKLDHETPSWGEHLKNIWVATTLVIYVFIVHCWYCSLPWSRQGSATRESSCARLHQLRKLGINSSHLKNRDSLYHGYYIKLLQIGLMSF